MDGIHDLGGLEGFGPVPTEREDEPFHANWEARMWAIARAGLVQDMTIDWFRHGLERMVPADYLSYPYFAKWCANYFMMLIDNGTLSMDEVISGLAGEKAPSPKAISVEDALELHRNSAPSYRFDTDHPPQFELTQAVVTKKHLAASHTRLPRYARNASGHVTAWHGPHIFPDASARGITQGQHLYTIEFSAKELWGEGADPRDTVCLDLWESYLVHP